MSTILTFEAVDEARILIVTSPPEVIVVLEAVAVKTEGVSVVIITCLKSLFQSTVAPIASPSIRTGIRVRFIEFIDGESKVMASPFTVITFVLILCTVTRSPFVKVIVSVSLFQSVCIPK